MVEEKPPEPTRPENAIPEHHTVLEGMEEARYESGDEQDPPKQNDNSQLDSPELEPRHKRQRHPSTPATDNTFGTPTYETTH